MTDVKIEDLASWGEPVRVNTKHGPRMLRKSKPTDKFSAAWKANKAGLKAAGCTWSKDRRSGEWEICWWQEVSEDEQRELAERREMSRAAALDEEFDVPVPDGLAYLPYQRAGIAYAMQARAGVLIADEMGLGKTVQAIGVINAIPQIAKVLIICPASLRLNWAREARKWMVRDLSISVIEGGKPEAWQPADVTIVNFDVMAKHRAAIDQCGAFDLVIVDEAHYLKNGKAKRTQAVLGGKDQSPILSKRTVFLTGTPIVNRPVELWPLVERMDPTGIGRNFFAFAKRYCDAKKVSAGRRLVWDFSGASNLGELQERLRETCMVRRLKADVLKELPAKQRQVITLPTNGAVAAVRAEAKAAAAHEEAMVALQAAVEIEKAGTQADYDRAVELLQKQAQVAFTEMSRQRHGVAMAKVPYVVEHLKESIESGPVVCFAHHRDVVAAIASEFERVGVITGDTPLAERQQVVDDFQAGKLDLVVGNIKAAGVGLTLTRSSHVVFAELSWVPGDVTQCEDRCHRIGQDSSVLVQHLVLDGSIDANMAQTIVDKQRVIDKALDDATAKLAIAPTRKQPCTVRLTRADIDKAAEQLTSDQVVAIHTGLKTLSAFCDGAESLDGMGFSKVDVRIGKELASWSHLTARQAVIGQKLCRKYRRQLPKDILTAAGIK